MFALIYSPKRSLTPLFPLFPPPPPPFPGRQVVITGAGVVSGCGCDLPTFVESVWGGKSSLGRISRFSLEEFPINCEVASEVPEEMFTPKPWFTNFKSVRWVVWVIFVGVLYERCEPSSYVPSLTLLYTSHLPQLPADPTIGTPTLLWPLLKWPLPMLALRWVLRILPGWG